MDRATLRALARVKRVLVVTTPDVMAVREARRIVDVLHEIDVPLQGIQVVVNDAHNQVVLSDEDIAALLGVQVVASLPYERRLLHEERAGGLAMVSSPRCAWVQGVSSLATFLVEGEVPTVRSGGFLRTRGV